MFDSMGLDPFTFLGGGTALLDPLTLSPIWWFKADAGTFQTVAGSAATANDDPVGSVLDQSGNGNDLSQATAGHRFLLKTNAQNSKSAIQADGVDDILRSASFARSQPYTLYLVAKSLAESGRFFDGNSVNDFFMFQPNDHQVSLYAGGVACQSNAAIGEAEIYAIVANGASSLIECGDRDTVTGDIGTNGIQTGIALASAGNESGGFFKNANYYEAFLCPAAHDLTTRDQVRAYFRSASRWRGLPHPICIGDSITLGTGASDPSQSYPSQLAVLLGASYEVTNLGVGGKVAADMDTDFTTTAGIKLSGLRDAFVCIFGGTNDIVLNGSNGSDVYASNLSMWQKTRAAGKFALAFTMLKRSTFDATMETYRQSYNTLVAANSSEYDALIDVASRSEFSNTGNGTYFADGVHLTDAGYAIVAQMVYDAIQGLI